MNNQGGAHTRTGYGYGEPEHLVPSTCMFPSNVALNREKPPPLP